MPPEISDVEPVVDFIVKVGIRKEYGVYEIDLNNTTMPMNGLVVVDRTQLELLAARLAFGPQDILNQFNIAFPGVGPGKFLGPPGA